MIKFRFEAQCDKHGVLYETPWAFPNSIYIKENSPIPDIVKEALEYAEIETGELLKFTEKGDRIKGNKFVGFLLDPKRCRLRASGTSGKTLANVRAWANKNQIK